MTQEEGGKRMNKTERPEYELLTDAANDLEDVYYLLYDVAESQGCDRHMRQSIRILRRIVSNAHVSARDLLKEMEQDK